MDVQIGARDRLQGRSGAGPDDGGAQCNGLVVLWRKNGIGINAVNAAYACQHIDIALGYMTTQDCVSHNTTVRFRTTSVAVKCISSMYRFPIISSDT